MVQYADRALQVRSRCRRAVARDRATATSGAQLLRTGGHYDVLALDRAVAARAPSRGRRRRARRLRERPPTFVAYLASRAAASAAGRRRQGRDDPQGSGEEQSRAARGVVCRVIHRLLCSCNLAHLHFVRVR